MALNTVCMVMTPSYMYEPGLLPGTPDLDTQQLMYHLHLEI